MSEYAGRISIGVILAVAAAVGTGYGLNNYVFTCNGGSYHGTT